MKKFHVYALSAAAACTMLGTTVFPSYAASAYSIPGGKMIVIGQNGQNSCQAPNFSGISLPGGLDLNDLISGCINTGNNRFPSGCQNPGISIPGGSGSQEPGTSNPGDSGNQEPGTSNPGDSGSQEPDSGTAQDSYAVQVAALVNEERAKAGLSPLTFSAEASAAAMTRAKETEISFSHTRPDGKGFSTALTDAGISFRSAGENIAYGQTSAAQVMESWMNSSGHRANILNGSYTQIGVAHYQNASGVDYWVQLFFD